MFLLIGPTFMESFNLNPQLFGFSFDYNFGVDPTMNNEFATGAFRFGHSLVQGFIKYEPTSFMMLQYLEHFSPHIHSQKII